MINESDLRRVLNDCREFVVDKEIERVDYFGMRNLNFIRFVCI